MNQIKAASNSAHLPNRAASKPLQNTLRLRLSTAPTTFVTSSAFVLFLNLLQTTPLNELTCIQHPLALHPTMLVDGQHCKILLIVFNSTCCPERIFSNHIALSNGLVRSNRCCFFLSSQLTNLYCRFRAIFTYVP